MALNYTFRVIDRLLRFDTTGDDVVATMLPFIQTPNALYEVHKTSVGDGHTVTVQVDASTSDFLLPDGSSAIVLDDANNTVYIKIPAQGRSPAYVNSGGGATGGQVIPSDAPPVEIIGSEVEELYGGKFEVRVNYQPGPGASDSNYKGAVVYLEDPDISFQPNVPMDGSVPLDGSAQLSGKWNPVRENDSFESPADILIDGTPGQRYIRVYLSAFNKVKNATLVRANAANPTPNIRISIPGAAGEYVSGQEYAWLITDPEVTVVDNFENPAGPTYSLRFFFTEPDDTIPLPPGMKAYGGVQTVYEYPSQGNRRAQARFLQAHKPETWISDEYAASTITFYVWFCSADVDGRVNTVVPGVTPMIQVDVVYPPVGQGTTPDISTFSLSNPRHAWQPDGTIYAEVDASWTPPESNRFASVEFYRVNPLPPLLLGVAGNMMTTTTLQVIQWPKVAEDWTVAAIAVDYNGRLGDDPQSPSARTPTDIWHIGPPAPGGTGQEYAPLVDATGATVTTEQELNSDGVVMMRHKISGWVNSADNSFGGVSIARVYGGDLVNATWWNVPKTDTTITTAWEPAPAARSWSFYFVSRDQQDRRNTILPGITPQVVVAFTPMAGSVIAARLPEGWWNPAEFQWPAYPDGQFEALQFVAQKIYVGSILRVGGGNATGVTDPSFAGQQNGQIAVYNSANVLRAWMGQQDSTTPDQPSTVHSIFGGWFSELYIGGDGPPTAPIYSTQAGTVIIGGWDVTGGRYPYISIRRNDGVEVGRIGAVIGQGLVANTDPAYIGGAWFTEFAVGGQSLADWRILARRDPTDPSTGANLVNIRNVNLFTIDYMQNYPNSTNPTNDAMHLEFGYDAFVADVANSSYWKFPGLSLQRGSPGALTGHGVVLINRGVILNAPGTPPSRRGSFITWNGDQYGSDVPNTWWTELTMISPTSLQMNVELNSGSASSGGSSFRLWDGANVLNFSVDTSGNVFMRGTLSLTTLSLTGNLTVGGSITANSSISGTQYFVGSTQVITLGGEFNGPGGVNTSGEIRTSSNLIGNAIYCGGTEVIDSSGHYIGGEVINTTAFIGGQQFGCYYSGAWTYGISNTFPTNDGRTVTVRGGIIVSIA